MPTGIDYRGGLGGSFGGSGFSGGGGGGASASVIFINGVTVAVAGGGGGGGGGGQYSPGLPNNNNPGTEGTTYGGYGQGKGGGDGAGGGGGGGGSNAPVNYPVSPSVPLYATTYPVWNGFLNTYGVWFSSGGDVGVWTAVNFTVDIPAGGGNYYFVVSADNHIELYVNGNFIVRNDDWAITNTSGTVSLSSGFQTINIQALNDGGPAGFAAAMYDLNNNMIWNSRVVAPAAGGGGLGGLTYGGDNGAYSGENGNCYVPPGGVVSSGSNGGAPNTTGGGGIVSITYWS